jgi:glycerate kinase
MKRILIAPNAFKGSLSAIEAALAIKSGLESLKLNIKCELAPIADGGDGTIDVINFYFKKSKFIECEVHDPLGRKIKSNWLLLDKETAIIELAKASGILLLLEDELNPMWANTYGTGELILNTLDKGCKRLIVTLGGSATVDAGVGILQSLGVKLFDSKKHMVKSGGGFLRKIQGIDLSSIDKRIKNCNLEILCDVKIPLYGEKGSVQKFASQKGAKEGEKIILEEGMKHYASVVSNLINEDFSSTLMVGSAGGVAFSLKALLNAKLHPGFLFLANLTSLEERIKNQTPVSGSFFIGELLIPSITRGGLLSIIPLCGIIV